MDAATILELAGGSTITVGGIWRLVWWYKGKLDKEIEILKKANIDHGIAFTKMEAQILAVDTKVENHENQTDKALGVLTSSIRDLTAESKSTGESIAALVAKL